MTEWYLGTIGFGYKDWVGGFYPESLRAADYLAFYSQKFNAVELDTTFYGVPKLSRVKQWAASVPKGFRFCAKLPRRITHEKGLKGARGELEEFVEAMRGLEGKLGALLIQLPQSFTAKEEKALGEFLEGLPRDVRFAVELRHASWIKPEIVELLRSFGVSWATTEYPRLPNQVKHTRDFLYIRWIGQHGAYDRHSYERVDKTPQLVWWRDQIEPYLGQVRDIYGFFNNDYAGFAAGTCLKFKRILGMIGESANLVQGRLF